MSPQQVGDGEDGESTEDEEAPNSGVKAAVDVVSDRPGVDLGWTCGRPFTLTCCHRHSWETR